MMSDIFLVCMLVVKGCQTLVMAPTSLLQQSLVNTVRHYLHHAALILSLVRVRNPGFLDKNLATTLINTSLMSDIFLMCMMIVKGCQTLVMGPTRLLQQPLVSTVPHYLQHAALILSLVRVRNPGFLDKNLATTLINTSLMSDIFLMCMMIVKGCQTLVMGPTRLLQQPLVRMQCLIATCCTDHWVL